MAASFAIAGRDNGFSAKERLGVLLAVAGQYRTAINELAAMSNLDVWYDKSKDMAVILKELERRVDPATRKRTEAALAKARTRDSLRSFDKLTHVVDGHRRFLSDPPLIQPLAEIFNGRERDQLYESIRAVMRSYRRSLQSDRRHLLEEFRLVDVARKVVGVGSVGTRAWVLLLLGRDDTDPLFLQAKEAQASVLEEFLGGRDGKTHGERVVNGQHIMQSSSDIFLGWDRVPAHAGTPRDYYVRQLRDWKGAAVVENMTPDTMALYGLMCASSLARAHARSGDRIALAAYLGGDDAFDRAVAEFSEAYADQNERDYDALVQADKDGRITAQRGL